MNIIILALLTTFDAFFFGYLNQRKKLFQNTLFKVWMRKGEVLYPYYRALQWGVDLAGLYIIYYFSGLGGLITTLIVIYFGFKERLYYIMLNERPPADNSNPYWLIRAWIIFGVIGYSETKFNFFFFLSSLMLLVSLVV